MLVIVVSWTLMCVATVLAVAGAAIREHRRFLNENKMRLESERHLAKNQARVETACDILARLRDQRRISRENYAIMMRRITDGDYDKGVTITYGPIGGASQE